MRRIALFATFLIATIAPIASRAQFIGPHLHDSFVDTSILRPPTGAKVAIIVFEDLGCPHCAVAHPIELQAAEQLHVPIVRYDYPLAYHIWTFEGAVCARYLQEKVSPKVAEQFRADVFASQSMIESKEDIQHFMQHWMQQHGLTMPAAIDPTGALAAKVQADYNLGVRLNIGETPTLVVVSRDNYQIVCGNDNARDPKQLFPVIRAALTQTGPAPAPTAAHKSTHPTKP